MFQRIKTLASLCRELGLRWSVFRLAHAFRLRSGLIRLQTPQYKWEDRPLRHWLKPGIPSAAAAYAEWRKQHAPRFFEYRKIDLAPPRNGGMHLAVQEADRLLNGELKYFSHEFHQTGFPPNWHQFPSTLKPSSSAGGLPSTSRAGDGIGSNARHWSQISDEHVIAGRSLVLPDEAIPNNQEAAPATNASQRHVDIKYVWEPNRFAFVYTLVRAYTAAKDEKYAEAFWILIEDWAERNPPNTGPNWMDGQEIALRLMAWTFGFYQFSNSPSSAPHRIAQFTQYLAAQAERIDKNIGYAISTKSNHTISEAFGLWMVGLLFPELKHAEKYFARGKQLLEEEASKQILPDGGYSMYALNYHRFILHLYLYAIRLAELNHSQFSPSLYSSISSSVAYLSNLIDPATGQMPVYGSNDGALVLPLNNCDFTDFRPLLQLGSVVATGQPIFAAGDWDEDVYWLCGKTDLTPNPSPERRGGRLPSPLGRRTGDEGETSFPHSGIYVLHNANSRAFIRCTDFKSRPSHADQLHVDLWMRGHNIACDAGTYLYSGEGIWRNGLARTSAHNTVSVDGRDQMTLLSRFTWTNWAKGKVLEHKDKLWRGEHDGYRPVRHRRTVMALEGDRWLVIDDLEADEPHRYTLHWLLNDAPFDALKPPSSAAGAPPGASKSENKNSIHLKYESNTHKIQTGLVNGEGKFSIIRADPNSTRGWRSRYYGHKEPAISLLLEAHRARARFWTFFGYESDVVESSGDVLKVNGMEVNYKTTDDGR